MLNQRWSFRKMRFLLQQRRFATRLVDATKVASKLANVEYTSELLTRCQKWGHAKQAALNMYSSPRVERIDIQYTGIPQSPGDMNMARGISTPYDCAQHISQMIRDRSAIALVNGKPHDMHRPLTEDSSLDFIHFKDVHEDPTEANLAFWRSCQMVMAASIEAAFDDKYRMRLLAFQPTPLKSGSFVADFRMEVDSTENFQRMSMWQPSENDLRAISQVASVITANAKPFEVLDSDSEEARQILQDDYRLIQVRNRLKKGQPLTLYRVGNYVQAHSEGPLIANTSQIGRFSLVSLRLLGRLSHTQSPPNGSPLQLVFRAQGVSLPSVFLTHFTTFDLLMRRAKAINRSVPEQPDYVEPLSFRDGGGNRLLA